MTAPDLRQQATWAAGDFSKVGVASALVSELVCEAVLLRANERVLDVATGAGNTAIAAARRSTDVVGVDFVPALLERAKERAHAERLHRITFQEAPNDALPFPDHSFDVVLSTFGHMFTPDPVRATAEMVRVARPGGRIAFTAWTPFGFNGAMFGVMGPYAPKSDLPPPVLWGKPAIVRERFKAYAHTITFTERTLMFRAPTAADWLAHMREFFGPTRMLWERLDDAQQASLTAAMEVLIAGFNTSGDETLLVPGAYLESVVYLK